MIIGRTSSGEIETDIFEDNAQAVHVVKNVEHPKRI